MKRMLSLLLVIAMFVSVTSLAFGEEFSVRNGIKFGMDAASVLAIEQANKSNFYTYSETITPHKDYIMYNKVSLAGLEDGILTYDLIYDRVYCIRYSWHLHYGAEYYQKTFGKPITSLHDVYLAAFDSLNSVLEEKYEKIGYISDGKVIYEDLGEKFSYKSYFGEDGKGKDIVGYNQYRVQSGNQDIIINILYYREMTKGTGGIDIYNYEALLQYENISDTKEDQTNLSDVL